MAHLEQILMNILNGVYLEASTQPGSGHVDPPSDGGLWRDALHMQAGLCPWAPGGH